MTKIKTASITEKAMLMSLSISYWGAKATDDSVVEELTTEHSTEREVHDYRKRLAPAEETRKFKIIRSRARTYLRDKTSPWIDGGTRILAAPLYAEVTKELHKFHSEWDEAVAEFIRKFAKIKEAEKKRQGTLFKEQDYPSVDRLKRKFGWDVRVFPIPMKGDWRVKGIDDSDAIEKQIDDQVKEAIGLATTNLWQRLHKVVKALAEKLAEADPTFRDSIIENIRELVALLPTMNIADDPKLEAMRKAVDEQLASLNPAELREDEKARKKTKDAADKLLATMASYLGGQP